MCYGSNLANKIHSYKMWTPDTVKQTVASYEILVFGKGSFENPYDGHTKRAIDVLSAYGVPFKLIDITEDESIMNALVEYSGWPIPQIFISSKLIGGSDVLLELHENGQLSQILRAIKNNLV